MPPPPRSTPACRRTSAPAPCAVTWTPPSLRPWRPTARWWSMKRKVGYGWRLRELMAAQGVYTATELVPLLRERGIDLSASQVHRLVSGTPERLSLQVLAALCDILSCTPADPLPFT